MVNTRYATDTITVLRSTSSTRGVGGELIKTYSTYIDVTGSFQNSGGDWRHSKDIEAFRKNKRFFCDVVDIVDTDRISHSGKIYEIINVDNQWNHHLEIEMKIRSTA